MSTPVGFKSLYALSKGEGLPVAVTTRPGFTSLFGLKDTPSIFRRTGTVSSRYETLRRTTSYLGSDSLVGCDYLTPIAFNFLRKTRREGTRSYPLMEGKVRRLRLKDRRPSCLSPCRRTNVWTSHMCRE